MVLVRYCRLILIGIFAILAAGLVGCAEDCEKEYQLCLAQIDGSLRSYSHDKTCRYPTMNRGDEKKFCDCEEEYQSCSE